MDKSNCTFGVTGCSYTTQFWAPCYDCFGEGVESQGACLPCIETCHKGHKLGTIRSSSFYCDCGANKLCNNLPNTATQMTRNIFREILMNDANFPVRNNNPVEKPNHNRNNNAIEKPNDKLITSFNCLAKKLFNVAEKDFVVSSSSIGFILSMLHHGALGNTKAQLTTLLKGKNSIEDLEKASSYWDMCGVKLANAIIVNKNMPVKQSYLDMMSNLALISNRDFSDKAAIVAETNSFIEKNTNGLIKDVLKEDMVDKKKCVMILVNTQYFKTVWEKPFEPSSTKKATFNEKTMVNMMNITSKFHYFDDDQVQMCHIPYKGEDFGMVIVLPKMHIVGTNLNMCMDYLMGSFVCNPRKVNLSIPKFTQRKRTNLIPLLKTLGLTDIFGPASKLNNMVELRPGEWSQVGVMVHEAVVIVDEVGTEAAATTTMAVTRGCMRAKPEKPVVFNADHPFVFGIKDYQTGAFLFVGDYHGN